nr:hypothetical protein [Streptomyces sp. e14]
MEERLQVHQDRVAGTGDQVLVVQVGEVEHVGEREQGAQAPVEPVQFGRRGAGAGLDQLRPAVARAGQQGRCAQYGRPRAGAVPVDQFAEVAVGRERAGLVHHPAAVGEAQHGDPASAPVRVAGGPVHRDQWAGVAAGQQPRDQFGAVLGVPVEQLGHGRYGVHAAATGQPGQYGVLGEQPDQAGSGPGVGDEVAEPGLRCRTRQASLHPGHLELQHQRAGRQAAQRGGRGRGELAQDAVQFGRPVDGRGEPGAQSPPRPARRNGASTTAKPAVFRQRPGTAGPGRRARRRRAGLEEFGRRPGPAAPWDCAGAGSRQPPRRGRPGPVAASASLAVTMRSLVSLAW